MRIDGALAIAIAASACESEQPPPPAAAPRVDDLPSFDAPELVRGRAVWIERCSPCHLAGLVGAPRILDKAAWAPRIAKGMDVLVRHATEGFESPAGNQMPARGGHAELGDAEVASAVAFVIAASR
ncbi:MAG: c-type cytochrome [Candidatus Binatia bacterium]